MFSISSLRLYFPTLETWASRSASLPTSLFLPVYLCTNVGPQGLLAAAWHVCSTIRHLAGSASPCLAESPLCPGCPSPPSPPTSLVGCFFFISLVVGLPYSLIFCQFWLFFVFKLLLSSFWLCEEAQCVYLRLHLGRKPVITFSNRFSIPCSFFPSDIPMIPVLCFIVLQLP